MIKGKNILIFGLGKEGLASANFLGRFNQISIIDEKEDEEIGKYRRESLKVKADIFSGGNFPQGLFDLIVRSPGLRPDNPNIIKYIQKGAVLTSSTKIFFDLCPCPIIGVTGTKGKGTTSTLIYELLKTQKKKLFLAGNIGIPMLGILSKLDAASLAVLELSSFQLMDLKKSPHVAVVLMITSEHLDWHKNRQEYTKAKESIVSFQNSNDFAVINSDYETANSFAKKTKAKVFYFSKKRKTNGAYLLNENIISSINKNDEQICPVGDISLPGLHNIENVLAAVTVAKIFNIKNENIVKVLKSFKGLAHRLQLVKEINGVKFYNDSFSTTPETAIAAIEAFSNPKILILGGSSKKSDFTDLGKSIAKDKNIKGIILIGEEAQRIKDAIEKAGHVKGKIIEGLINMKEIVEKSAGTSSRGDVVILSPACASFDMFKNYEDRGNQFIKEVQNLAE